MDRRTIGVVAGVAALCLTLGCCAGAGVIATWNVNRGTVEAPGGAITLAKYNALENGISYAQTVQILGREGKHIRNEVLRQTEGPSTVIRIYMWTNPDGSSVTLEFVGDTLTDKKQTGLR